MLERLTPARETGSTIRFPINQILYHPGDILPELDRLFRDLAGDACVF